VWLGPRPGNLDEAVHSEFVKESRFSHPGVGA
jgi:hypothetical protein